MQPPQARCVLIRQCHLAQKRYVVPGQRLIEACRAAGLGEALGFRRVFCGEIQGQHGSDLDRGVLKDLPVREGNGDRLLGVECGLRLESLGYRLRYLVHPGQRRRLGRPQRHGGVSGGLGKALRRRVVALVKERSAFMTAWPRWPRGTLP